MNFTATQDTANKFIGQKTVAVTERPPIPVTVRQFLVCNPEGTAQNLYRHCRILVKRLVISDNPIALVTDIYITTLCVHL